MGDELLGKDLKLVASDSGLDLMVQNGDLVLATGMENLVQALSLRLSNHRGILKQLGHGDYGSRLLEAVGRLKNRANLEMVENLVREAVLQEPRVGRISSLSIHEPPAYPGTLEVDLSVVPITEATPLNLVITLHTGQ